jgi:hypothetical protein
MCALVARDYTREYARMDAVRDAALAAEAERRQLRPALSNFLRRGRQRNTQESGFRRMDRCRQALQAIDRRGWERSYHQRQFHDQFLRACTRVFWKTEQHGEFARCHQKILEQTGWDHLSQEILVSTPRRFGKTISVSMFAAAMIYSAPNVEVSIYSTCKRISQKLLRNIHKFLELIYTELGTEPYRVERLNMEEIAVWGPEGDSDLRIVNSYPSKVNGRLAQPHTRESGAHTVGASRAACCAHWSAELRRSAGTASPGMPRMPAVRCLCSQPVACTHCPRAPHACRVHRGPAPRNRCVSCQ